MPSGFTGPPLNLPKFADNEHNWGEAMDQSIQDINDAIGALQTSGTLPSGAANLVIATPNGSSGLSSLRALVAADIPSLPESKITNLTTDLSNLSASIAGLTFSSIGGVASVAQIPSLPASQITSGQLPLARGGTGADLSGVTDGLLTFKSGSALATSALLSWDDTNKKLNLTGTGTSATNGLYITGTTSGSSILEIHNSFASGINLYTHSNTDFRAPTIACYRSGGTQASPTNLLAGYALGYLSFLGYDGSAYATGANFEAQMGSAWNTGNHNCSITVSANLANSATLTPVFVFNSTSNNGGDVDGNISRINFYIQNTKALAFLSGDTTPTSGLSQISNGVIGIGNGTQGDFSATVKLTLLNAVTGIQINGGATSGNVLRGNGTNFVSSTLAFSDLSSTFVATDSAFSLATKPSVGLVADSNISLTGVQTIDGVLGSAGVTLVLATAQSTGSQNGPWLMQSGAWTRPAWYPSGGTTQAFQFITTFVRLGTNYSGTEWRLTTAGAITIDTTATTWVETPFALNATSVSGVLPAANYVTMVGDSGSGGTKGAVPAPGSGDAAAAKFLKADGTWAVPAGSGGSGVNTSGSPANHQTAIFTGSASITGIALGNSGAPLLSAGAGADPAYGALNLGGGSNVISGVLPGANGGVAAIATSGQGYFMAPTGMTSMVAAGTSATLTANHIRAFQFVLPYGLTFTKMTTNVVASSNGNKFFVGIYSADGTTLLRQGTFSLTASTGVYTITVSSTALSPGAYWFVWGADNTAVTVTAWGNTLASNVNVFNQNTVRLGDSNQTISSGVLPSGIGTVTAANTNIPVVMLEP